MRVHDAYVAGEGILHAAVLGLVPMVNLRGTGEVARGELMRFFAEAAWYPTALLPSQDVLRDAVDDHSSRATLSANDGDAGVRLAREEEAELISALEEADREEGISAGELFERLRKYG